MREAIRLKGMPVMVAALFCYTAIETTSALWASSYITIRKGLPDDVGALGTTFLFLGMTVGRFASGFISDRLGDQADDAHRSGPHCRGLARPVSALRKDRGARVDGGPRVWVARRSFPASPLRATGLWNWGHGSAVSLLMGSSQLATLLMPIAFGWIADLGGMGFYPFFQIFFAAVMMAALVYQRKHATA